MAGIHYKARHPHFQGKAANVYTQYGEDGLIAAALDLIGETNRWCFEVGASDGKFYSNTLCLRERGWDAVLMEADLGKFGKLNATYGDKSICVHAEVTNLDVMLSKYDVPHDLDFGVIDVDGQDYWLWYDMTLYRPRIMLVEFCPSMRSKACPHESYIPERHETEYKQAPKSPIIELGMSKGYTVVAQTNVNLLFIRGDLL